MAESKKPKTSGGSKTKSKPAPKSVDLNVGGNIDGNVVVGDNNVINNYYPVVEKNIEKHEPDFWALKHPYPMPPNFTGRIAERALLTHWLKEDTENRLFILRALGGFGKSALAWQWLTHDVDIKEYPKVLWWSFYEGDASFEHFIEETLKYLKLEIPQGQRPQVDELLKAMQSQTILLIMDGFERALRAYSSMNAAYQGDDEPGLEDNQLDCVNINAEIFLKSVCSLPSMKSKVLMTTRLTPRAVKPHGECLQGCREEKLEAMQKADAVEFFHKQKIKGTHAEIEAACAPYGYHPLSLRLLAGRILKDFENPADIVVAQKLKIDGDIIQQKHHVLEVSYNSLPSHEQKLLSTIACFRSPVELKILESISKPPKDEKPKGLARFFKKKTTSAYAGNINTDLKDLVERGLLHFDDKNKKFDLHPIVRRYAYERLTAPDRTAAHARLRNYFAGIDMPKQAKTIDELAPVIELYHHTVQAGEFDKAQELYVGRLATPLYSQLGAYQTEIELMRALFPIGENMSPTLKEEAAQAWVLTELANAYSISGQSSRSVSLLKIQITIREKQDNKKGIAIGLGNIAEDQLKIGALAEAENSLRRRIDLCREIGDEFREAIGHQELGRVLSYRGSWTEAEQQFDEASAIKIWKENLQGYSINWLFRCLRFLMIARADSRSKIENIKSGLICAEQALELLEEIAKPNSGYVYRVRDFIRVHWQLGGSLLANVQLDLAEQHLSEALTRDRAINMVDYEAYILLDLTRLRYLQKRHEEAKSLAEEALLITERCGYVLQGADVNLFLAQYALEQEKDKAKAKKYAETALKLAYCDGPPYYYKVAYHEAERFLENLK